MQRVQHPIFLRAVATLTRWAGVIIVLTEANCRADDNPPAKADLINRCRRPASCGWKQRHLHRLLSPPNIRPQTRRSPPTSNKQIVKLRRTSYPSFQARASSRSSRCTVGSHVAVLDRDRPCKVAWASLKMDLATSAGLEFRRDNSDMASGIRKSEVSCPCRIMSSFPRQQWYAALRFFLVVHSLVGTSFIPTPLATRARSVPSRSSSVSGARSRQISAFKSWSGSFHAPDCWHNSFWKWLMLNFAHLLCRQCIRSRLWSASPVDWRGNARGEEDTLPHHHRWWLRPVARPLAQDAWASVLW